MVELQTAMIAFYWTPIIFFAGIWVVLMIFMAALMYFFRDDLNL